MFTKLKGYFQTRKHECRLHELERSIRQAEEDLSNEWNLAKECLPSHGRSVYVLIESQVRDYYNEPLRSEHSIRTGVFKPGRGWSLISGDTVYAWKEIEPEILALIDAH